MRPVAQGNALCARRCGLDSHMISVQDALAVIDSHKPTPPAERVAIAEAAGRVLAEDLTARNAMPPFASANMDGYAVGACLAGDTLTLIGESAAGHPFSGAVTPGTAIRISTGAMMPEGADRVLMKENAEESGTQITALSAPKAGEHVRPAASDVSVGAPLLSAGANLTPANLTLAAAAGYAALPVRQKLKIAILSSGDELRPVGMPLKSGEIFAANAIGLAALLTAWGAEVTDLGILPDTPNAPANILPELNGFDIIIPIGGASIGDHDHMRPAFEAAEYSVLFSTVAMRPGKPCWMAEKSGQIIFGLPGNPASAFVCAFLFLRPLLSLPTHILQAVLTQPVDENGPRETYLRARAYVEDGQIRVTPENQQESFRLRPQSRANALVKLPPMGGPYRPNDVLDILLIGELVRAE